jgi:flap endonuclease-1
VHACLCRAIRETKIESYFGRKIALDASMAMYQFMIATRIGDGTVTLTNADGEVTSHLSGLLSRTIRMLEVGIKPVWVFDGKAPDLKRGELDRRKEKRAEASAALDAAKEAGDEEEVRAQAKRLVSVTREMNEDAKKMLRLMGVPVIESATEAEAQCAVLCKAGKVYGVGSEDMDTLTFGSTKLIRNLNRSEALKLPVLEISLDSVLEDLKMTMDQFIDLCVLMGCDYCGTIKGVGPKKAYELIAEHGSIEKALTKIDREKFTVPDNFEQDIVPVHEFFVHPEVQDVEAIELKWNDPDEEGLLKFLCDEKQFSRDRITKSLEKIKKSRGTATQVRDHKFMCSGVKRIQLFA